MAKVFVGNFSFSVSEDSLKEYFSKVGNVTSCRIMKEGPGGRSRGFGFVEFGTREEAEKAIKELDGSQWEGRAIKVSEDKTGGKRPEGSSAPGGGYSSSYSNNSSYSNSQQDGGYSNKQQMGYFRAQPLDIGVKRKKKMDPFIEDETLFIDYKNQKLLSRFISERGRILPRRMTGLTSANQRHVAQAIKRAQHLAILPYRG